jgi:hypothetical protein
MKLQITTLKSSKYVTRRDAQYAIIKIWPYWHLDVKLVLFNRLRIARTAMIGHLYSVAARAEELNIVRQSNVSGKIWLMIIFISIFMIHIKFFEKLNETSAYI